MQLVHQRRRRLGSACLATTALIGAGLVPAAARAADVVGTITVTSPSNARIAAGSAKQVLAFSVSGADVPALSEDNVNDVSLKGNNASGAATTCVVTYVVTSSTTIIGKTATNCAILGAASLVVTIGTDTLVKTNALTLVTPPSIADVGGTVPPVINDNSVLLNAANQTARFSATGGQTVRVRAGASFGFDPTVAAGLAVTMNGKAGSNFKVFTGSTGLGALVQTTTSSTPGNSMTFTTGAGMTPGPVSLTITQGGITKTFTATATSNGPTPTVVSLPSITSLSVPGGRASQQVSTTITGTGLPRALGDAQDPSKWLITFCGAAVVGSDVTAVNDTGTSVTVNVPPVSGLSPGLGAGVYAGICPVAVTDLTQNPDQTSPVALGAYYTVLAE
ncbi:hypothetical protein [Cryptosporangium sp. NPDC048952]|uniref:hypothetical protein n=1 Tax=Cryptosporangium sp. NPDC048952 TaxID=3363961 RepID=UPI0037241D90